jgi:hypothetical protein
LFVHCQAVDEQLDGEVVRLSGDGLERQLFELIRVGFEPPRCVAASLQRMLYIGVLGFVVRG